MNRRLISSLVQLAVLLPMFLLSSFQTHGETYLDGNVIVVKQDGVFTPYLAMTDNLGSYLGNNYQSAVITAKNAIKAYPYSKYKEKLEMLILKSRFKEAQMSVDEKKEERFRTVVDEYYAFINDYPNSENRKEADNIFKIADKFLNRK